MGRSCSQSFIVPPAPGGPIEQTFPRASSTTRSLTFYSGIALHTLEITAARGNARTRRRLGGERKVAPLRRFEVEHGGPGHLELGRTVVGLGILGRAGDGVDEPVLAQVAALDDVPQDRGLLVLGEAQPVAEHLHGLGDVAFELRPRSAARVPFERARDPKDPEMVGASWSA